MDLKRSWMFVPGHRQRFIDKAMTLDCDVMMLDIEDGVPPDEKPAARELIAEALGRPKTPGSPARFVRINSIGHERSEADLAAVVRPGLEGLVLPKVQYADEVRTVADYLDGREPEAGLEPQSIGLHVAIESPRGMFNALAIAEASSRVVSTPYGRTSGTKMACTASSARAGGSASAASRSSTPRRSRRSTRLSPQRRRRSTTVSACRKPSMRPSRGETAPSLSADSWWTCR